MSFKKKVAVFLYAVYSVFFGIYIFKKKYTYIHITYVTTATTATWGRVIFCGEEKQRKTRSTRSTENGWRYTGKCGVTARGRVFFCGEEKQPKSRSTRSTENG